MLKWFSEQCLGGAEVVFRCLGSVGVFFRQCLGGAGADGEFSRALYDTSNYRETASFFPKKMLRL